MFPKRFETNVEVEVNPQQISPTDSEDMKYCATEADQFYKNFPPQYEKPSHATSPLQHHGADSATDSAIDMPGDGSVSTINEIPPHHSTAILSNSYHKHTPTVADYSDIRLQSDIAPNDSRPRAFRTSKYSKPVAPSLLSPDMKIANHPILYEYSKPPTNRSLVDNNDSVRLQTFQTANHSRDSSQQSHNLHRHDSSRHSDESVTV